MRFERVLSVPSLNDWIGGIISSMILCASMNLTLSIDVNRWAQAYMYLSYVYLSMTFLE